MNWLCMGIVFALRLAVYHTFPPHVPQASCGARCMAGSLRTCVRVCVWPCWYFVGAFTIAVPCWGCGGTTFCYLLVTSMGVEPTTVRIC